MANIEKPTYISKEEKNGITKELLHELFDYKDGFLYWKVRKSKKTKIGSIAGNFVMEKYGPRHRLRINTISYYSHRLIFLWHYGWSPETIDHKDINQMNNKIENLRPATQLQNCRNRKSVPNSSSKYLGVCLMTVKKKHTLKNGESKLYISIFWKSAINIKGKHICVGSFKSEKEAAVAYNKAAKIHYGEFANLNIIDQD